MTTSEDAPTAPERVGGADIPSPTPPGDALGATSISSVLDARLVGASGQEQTRILREHYRPIVDRDPVAWISSLAATCDTYQLSLPNVRSLCADLAWQARTAGHAYPRDLPGYQPPSAGRHGLVGVYVEAYRLRFDYRFDELGRQCNAWLSEFPGDALLLAFAAFAALGSRQPQGIELYRAAVESPDADRRSRHTCLAAMWFAHHIAEQPDHILHLSGVMMANGETDNNVFYRRAAALRKLGRFDQAIEDIDRAISMLGPGDNLVHQDYMRERELIVSSMEMRAFIDEMAGNLREALIADAAQRIDVASGQLGERVDAAQRVVSDGLLKIVEILGLFVALIGFVTGSGVVAFKATTFGERALAMALVLVGSVLFFTLLRFVVSFRRR